MKVNIAVDNSSKRYGKGKLAMVAVEAIKTPCRGVVLSKRLQLAGYALTHVNTGQSLLVGDGEKSKARLLKIALKLSKVDFNFALHKTYKDLKAAIAKADPKIREKIRTAIYGKPKKETKKHGK